MTRTLSLVLLGLLSPATSAQTFCDYDGGGVVNQSAERADPGDTVTFSYTFGNGGNGPCPSVEVGHYLSTDRYLSDDDVLLGTDVLPEMPAQTNAGGSGSFTVPELPRGGYRLLAVADHLNEVDELNEDNNVEFGRLTIGGDASGPDLIVSTADSEDTEVAPGDRITVEYRLRNLGSSDVEDFEVGFVLVRRHSGQSPPPILLLGTETAGGLEAGEADDESEQLTLPDDLAAGRYNLGVLADYENAIEESDETNNSTGAAILTVSGTTSAGEHAGGVAVSLSASPNPSSGVVSLGYALAVPAAVRLAVFDALGREVAVAVSQRLGVGAHVAEVDASRWAPGVYVVRLSAGGEVAARTVTVAR